MPSALLDAHAITHHLGERTLLDGIDLRVDAGSRIGLVGANGSGKSTLLRILAGELAPDGGRVTRPGTVGYLPQMVEAHEARRSVREVIAERIGLAAASRELDRHADALARGELDALEPHAAALERWLALGGADADARLLAALAELGLEPALLERPLAQLSGGQAARAGLAALAVARFDVVLLDEPTNHLDADGLERLAGLLRGRAGGLVLVSHDRAVLDAVATEIVELDLRTGTATHRHGNWSTFERERGRARERAQALHDRAVTRRAQLLEAEREMRRRAEASVRHSRSHPRDGDKNGREWVKMRAEEAAGRARKVGGRAERIEVPEAPWRYPRLGLRLTAAERRGDTLVALEAAVVRRGDWRLGPLDIALSPGERLLLTGPNGSGKSSLLGALAGTVRLAAGRRRLAPGAVIARIGQARDELAGDGTLTARVRGLTGLDESSARTVLAAFGLGGDPAGRPAATLSPGELTRAELAVIAHRGAACLLLDEPTNHLDVESLEVLEAALDGWPGALAVASHDLRLRAGLRIDRELALA